MILTLITIAFCYSLSFLCSEVRGNTCDTYSHPQYGIGQCIDQSQCPNALYLSGLCETQSANFKCCYSLAPMKEEFRAIWIATVNNIDWPSSKTAPTATQQSELINILNTVQKLNMNAVIFQVIEKSYVLRLSKNQVVSLYYDRFVQLVTLCMSQHWSHGASI